MRYSLSLTKADWIFTQSEADGKHIEELTFANFSHQFCTGGAFLHTTTIVTTTTTSIYYTTPVPFRQLSPHSLSLSFEFVCVPLGDLAG